MNILYIHGFGSRFDPASEKVQILGELGTVYGVDLDYSQPFSELYAIVEQAILDNEIDLLVGTSMGGWTVAEIGTDCAIPFVAINPARNPRVALRRYLGTHTDYTGREYTLTEDVLTDYSPFPLIEGARGIVLLDSGDEVIDSSLTHRTVRDAYPTFVFEGGNHRFEHMAESLHLIRIHFGRTT